MKLFNLIANSPAGPVLAIAFVLVASLLADFVETIQW
jgi:hypothetical protein